jgi:arylsulfatase A-like enzyme
MKRISILILALAFLGSGLGCDNDRDALSGADRSPSATSTPAESSKPSDDPPLNVILITVDTLRADALGAYGQKRFTSPNLDRLAREGVVFLHAMASAPSTLPSHASIMTAKHPYAHGARANAGYILPAENETLAEVLQRNAYRTGAETAAPVISHLTQLNQGFDQYRDLSSGDIVKKKSISVRQADGSKGTIEVDERTASDITDFGIRFLRENQDAPFFLWLHYFDPHAHYTAPSEYGNLIPDSPYHAEVRYVDSQIGRLIRNLEVLHLQGRTLLVVTSDHGESLMEHGEQTHSSYLFETTMHVPLIFWGAKSIPKDWQVNSMVRTIDIAPTILELLGLSPLEEAQGRSLVPLMTGERRDLQLTGYGESIELHSMFGSSILRTIRQDRWKYIHKLRPALYDLVQDPKELDDLARQHPEKVEELYQVLRDEIRNAPASPDDARVAVDEATLLQLQALGYTGAVPSANLDDELATLEPNGPDPDDLFEDVKEYGAGFQYSSIAKHAEAHAIFEGLVERHPKRLQLLTTLAYSLIHLERYADAVAILHRAIETDPEHVKAYTMLARCEEAQGHLEESEAATRIALGLRPCSAVARLQLAQILEKSGRYEEQLAILGEGVDQCPDVFEVMNNYAYLLSSSPNPDIRDGAEAVRVAKLAVEKSGGARPAIMDTLAGAYAEVGDFKRAVEVSRRAVALARNQKMPQGTIDALEMNFESFRQGKPARTQ